MNVSKEVRIGLLVTIALVVLFTGFYFLKGSDLVSDERTYFCYFNNVSGLVKSANVELNGLEVGHVTALDLTDDNRIKVTLSIDKDILIKTGSKSTISSSNILNGKVIKIELGTGADHIKPEGTIPSVAENDMLANIGNQVEPTIKNINVTLSALDTVLVNVNRILGADNRQQVNEALASINATTKNLERLTNTVALESESIRQILKNTSEVSATLARNDDTLTRIFANLNSITGQLSRAPMEKTVTDMQKSISELEGILAKVNNNQGSLGMIVNDKNLYNNLDGTLKNLQLLLADLKEHPTRYINLTVFGRKK